MFFGKKKRMIDVRELQRRGVVRIPKENVVVPTDRDGFVEFGSGGSSEASPSTSSDSSSSNADFFGFAGSGPSALSSPDSFSNSTDGYDKREVDEKIVALDNKIYKLEQRIELLERKLDVGGSSAGSSDSSDSGTGVMGW